MEPETSVSKLETQQAPAEYGLGVEHAPQINMPEVGIETGAERYEQAADAAASASQVAGAVPILPSPVISSIPQDATVVVDTTAAPLTANDDDLIEKEWVDKAKKIVAQTRDDPFKREEAVSQLQKDYQKKRYGRELGAPQ